MPRRKVFIFQVGRHPRTFPRPCLLRLVRGRCVRYMASGKCCAYTPHFAAPLQPTSGGCRTDPPVGLRGEYAGTEAEERGTGRRQEELSRENH